ncbi:hypothetical protein HMPREF9064_1362 [Aggregatibacter segnis ATCC 33393]|uniref:Uncharacterized protein n=1 Tax=Aggregatibacter segnis ATCC 33393 TaxID=888057 RepID=E6KYY0_9PAST|nr:hypothetical protein HMPREF9064_1362 [Aggregatibacter segnis ATCC 33393]SQH65290.1 Uncharacterised protein [Aggregatibacter segnis ATCC 33393]
MQIEKFCEEDRKVKLIWKKIDKKHVTFTTHAQNMSHLKIA